MSYLIDTDWVIDFLNGQHRAIELFQSIPAPDINLSVVTYGEVLEGIVRRERDQETRTREFDQFVADLNLREVDQAIANSYARERSRLRSIGMMLPENDLWIAATALVHGLQLVSNDQHFDRIASLTRYSP